jgi:sialic acid synthase SpsE
VVTEVAVAGHESLRPGACRVIAEAGANHNNDVDRAIELARRAGDAGAWAVKFQLYKAESIAIRNSPKYWSDDFGTATQFEAYQKSDKLDYHEFRSVADACADAGIIFFATPFDFAAVDVLEELGAPIYKIASGDITHRPLLEAVAATKKPVLLSTGAASEDEIDAAIDWLGGDEERIVVLCCTLTYPTPDDDANFARIQTMQERFKGFLIGMSDHTLGPEGGWMTAALGGVCIEKHYTLDKSLPDVPDHAMSVDPSELATMVEMCDRGARLRGDASIGVRESEMPARLNARRSIVLARPLSAGAVVGHDDLDFKRPGAGLAPSREAEVIGRRVTRDLDVEHVLTEDDFQ